eukprot:355797-Chlamydomonas_euryale.AAC.2
MCRSAACALAYTHLSLNQQNAMCIRAYTVHSVHACINAIYSVDNATCVLMHVRAFTHAFVTPYIPSMLVVLAQNMLDSASVLGLSCLPRSRPTLSPRPEADGHCLLGFRV